jgi:hypothetical protein
MPANTKSRTVNYRRCVAESADAVDKNEKFDLQGLLENAKKINVQPWSRPIGLGGTQSQYLMYLTNKQQCLCGSLVLCEDKLIPLVDSQKDGTPWEGKVEPKDAEGNKRKLEEHALFFAVRENHIAIVQTKELSISDLQDFLIWFIHTKAQLATGWSFHLLNLPAQSAIEKLKDHSIRGVKIGRKPFWIEKTPVPSKKTATKRQHYTRTLKTDPLLFGVLKKVIKDDALVDELMKSKDPGSIYVALEISYRSRDEKDGQEVMRAVAASFGANADLSPEIRLNGKTKIKGEELTIAGQVDIQCPDGNFSKDDAMTRIAEWLLESIKSGRVLL